VHHIHLAYGRVNGREDNEPEVSTKCRLFLKYPHKTIIELTLRRRVRDKVTAIRPIKKSPSSRMLCEAETSLPHSQEPSTCPYSELDHLPRSPNRFL
jgi:hypothetical protein